MVTTVGVSSCETQYTQDVSGIYAPADSIHRSDTVVLWTNINPDSEGIFLHRFRDNSGTLRLDSGSFFHLTSWADTPDHLGYVYGVEFSKWVEAKDSVGGPVETAFFKGNQGQIFLNLGVVQIVGHHIGGKYVKVGSIEYRPLSRFSLF